MRAGWGGATLSVICMARNLFKFGKKTQTILRYQSNRNVWWKECQYRGASSQCKLSSVGQQKALPEDNRSQLLTQ